MVILYFLLALFGLLMIIKPSIVWALTESWKTDDGSEPSDLYNLSIRIGGVFCFIAGSGGVIAFWL